MVKKMFVFYKKTPQNELNELYLIKFHRAFSELNKKFEGLYKMSSSKLSRKY